jgi:hypothetical protein
MPKIGSRVFFQVPGGNTLSGIVRKTFPPGYDGSDDDEPWLKVELDYDHLSHVPHVAMYRKGETFYIAESEVQR